MRARDVARDAMRRHIQPAPPRTFLLAFAEFLLAIPFAAMAADPPQSFSARLDALWDYDRPGESDDIAKAAAR